MFLFSRGVDSIKPFLVRGISPFKFRHNWFTRFVGVKKQTGIRDGFPFELGPTFICLKNVTFSKHEHVKSILHQRILH